MEWLTEILGAGASAATGGVFGLIGSLLGVGAKYVQKRQELKFEKAKWDHELALIDKQAELRQLESESELAVVNAKGSWAGLEASYQMQVKGEVSQWANNIRALFRPFLTVFLWILAGVALYWLLSANAVLYVTPEYITEIVRYAIHTVFFTASAAGLWWFGDRAMTPPGAKNR